MNATTTTEHNCPKCGLVCRVHVSAAAAACPKCGRVFPLDMSTVLVVRQFVATLGSQALRDVADGRWDAGMLDSLYWSMGCGGDARKERSVKAAAEWEASFQSVA